MHTWMGHSVTGELCTCVGLTHACIRPVCMSVASCTSAGICTYASVFLSVYICVHVCLPIDLVCVRTDTRLRLISSILLLLCKRIMTDCWPQRVPIVISLPDIWTWTNLCLTTRAFCNWAKYCLVIVIHVTLNNMFYSSCCCVYHELIEQFLKWTL